MKRPWPARYLACPLCDLSVAAVSYGGSGMCADCKCESDRLEVGIRALMSLPEGSDLWTLGMTLRSWGTTGVCDQLRVEVDVVRVWVSEQVLPSSYRSRLRELWAELAPRAMDWGIKAAGKSGRRRAG